MVNLHIERKLQVNGWLIRARFFYGLGVLFIGVLSKLLSRSNVNFPFSIMILLLVIFNLINLLFYFYYHYNRKIKSQTHLQLLGSLQISMEIFTLAAIMHYAGGIESVSPVFFFLPIVSSSFLFGSTGSIITGAISAIVINSLVAAEYYGVIPHVYRYGLPTVEFLDISVALTKTISISVFYLIVGTYSGYGSRLLFHREEMLETKTQELVSQKDLLSNREKKLSDAYGKLREEKNKISAIISNFTDPIIFIDSAGVISLFNPVAREVLGFDEKTIGQKINSQDNFSLENFRQIIKKEYRINKIINQNSQGDSEGEEISFLYKEQERNYKVMTASVCDEKRICYGYIKVFYDLTREKRLDKLKSEFISIAAHQLRTPLSAIKWATKMVLDGDAGPVSAEQKEFLSQGYKSNERIITLVNDMLNVSRIEEGRFGFSFAMDDFFEPLNEVIGSLKNQIETKHIKFLVSQPEKLPLVYFDKKKMVLVLQNLLENAVKYTPDYGRIEIGISILKKFLKISIKDNGVGIPHEDQEKLFTKFFRAKNVMRLQTEGSGLGLFIVKNIVLQHGGEISCKSKEGEGTEFVFTVLLRKP